MVKITPKRNRNSITPDERGDFIPVGPGRGRKALPTPDSDLPNSFRVDHFNGKPTLHRQRQTVHDFRPVWDALAKLSLGQELPVLIGDIDHREIFHSNARSRACQERHKLAQITSILRVRRENNIIYLRRDPILDEERQKEQTFRSNKRVDRRLLSDIFRSEQPHEATGQRLQREWTEVGRKGSYRAYRRWLRRRKDAGVEAQREAVGWSKVSDDNGAALLKQRLDYEEQKRRKQEVESDAMKPKV